jgi:DNA repair protein RecO (recombination protein O)
MLEKTTGIVLHQLKYSDSGIVLQIYTKSSGRQSFMLRGIRNRKVGRHNVHLQPLSVIDFVMYFKESRGMHTLKEFSVSYSPVEIHSNIKKSCIAIFLGEVLTSVLKEESAQEELFDYIKDSIIYFDNIKDGYSNFHIAFLTGLCSFLGFEPGKRTRSVDKVFDMVNGIFVPIPPSHGNYANIEISGILSDFFNSSWDDMNKIPLSGAKRNEVLMALLKYYSTHLPSLKKIKSLEILKEVFS